MNQKSYKSFKEISKQYLSIEHLFEKESMFLAHTHSAKENETLHEHILKVKVYFEKIVQVNNLEPVINILISKISFDKKDIGEYLKVMFFHSIIFHDFGKINDNFQAERMNNPNFKKDNSIKIGFEHSFLSAYFFLNHKINEISFDKINHNEQMLLYLFAFLFSIPILKHHSSYLQKDYDFKEDKIKSIQHFLKNLNLKISFEQICSLIDYEKSDKQQNLWLIFNNEVKNSSFDYFSLFALLKLNYSLLTASDYYATTEYMNGLKFNTEDDFGLLTEKLKQKIYTHFVNNKETSYNGKLIENPQKYLSVNIEDLQEKSFDNLNFLRQKLGAEVLTNIGKYKEQRIFYIEAPTGGGKTNMSMIAVYKMLQLHPEINKIFYVFPFTTLITQTAKAIKETLGLTEHEVTEVHSKSGFQTKNTGDNEQDAKYGTERRNQIDNLFINYPLTLLTHIKFFDILKSNKKDTNYILHRLANSVVIIDELQAYSPEHWDKIKFYISKYAELFNMRFIIMSATLPKIDKIKMAFDTHFEELIPEAKKYLTNPNFAERVSIKTELLEKKKIELSELADILLEKSKKYAVNRKDKYPDSVYTIIEFIFKKSASEFYEIISKKNEKDVFFDEIFVLSGTIIEPRRKYIIEYLKDENNRKKKILLITTQVVEAGVNIDMDLGFKNQSLIDSDEQLAGRINRNVRKQNCELYLFKHDPAKSIYGKDDRYKVTANFKPDFIQEILTNKNFDKLYDEVFNEIDKLNTSGYKTNFNTYIEHFERLDFENIHKDFKLIESENASIFVPLDIDIFCYGNENNFSDKEFDFIENNKCLENKTTVSGEKIWDLYVSLIENPKEKFSADFKILNGIMSKFVFSIFMKKISDLNSFIEYIDDNFENNFQQYYKFKKDNLAEIYTKNSGINEKYLEKITKSNFEFI